MIKRSRVFFNRELYTKNLYIHINARYARATRNEKRAGARVSKRKKIKQTKIKSNKRKNSTALNAHYI